MPEQVRHDDEVSLRVDPALGADQIRGELPLARAAAPRHEKNGVSALGIELAERPVAEHTLLDHLSALEGARPEVCELELLGGSMVKEPRSRTSEDQPGG